MSIKKILKITLLFAFSMQYLSAAGAREIYNPNGLEVGIYSPNVYNFCKEVKEDGKPDRHLPLTSLPGNLNAALPANIAKRVSFVLLGPLETNDAGTTYNVCFHRILREWRRGSHGFNPNNVQANLEMGIFDGYAVSALVGAEAIPFNRLAAQNVNLHSTNDPLVNAYSPNNAHFTVDKRKPFSSFWTVALSPDNRNAYIAFVVLVHDGNLEKEIKQNLSAMQNHIGAALTETSAIFKFSPEDKAAFEKVTALAFDAVEDEQQEAFASSAAAGGAGLVKASSSFAAHQSAAHEPEQKEFLDADFLLATRLQEEERRASLPIASAAAVEQKRATKEARVEAEQRQRILLYRKRG